MEILKILLDEYFRKIEKPSFLFSYFWCQTSPISPRAPDPGWFFESRTFIVGTSDTKSMKTKKKAFNTI